MLFRSAVSVAFGLLWKALNKKKVNWTIKKPGIGFGEHKAPSRIRSTRNHVCMFTSGISSFPSFTPHGKRHSKHKLYQNNLLYRCISGLSICAPLLLFSPTLKLDIHEEYLPRRCMWTKWIMRFYGAPLCDEVDGADKNAVSWSRSVWTEENPGTHKGWLVHSLLYEIHKVI